VVICAAWLISDVRQKGMTTVIYFFLGAFALSAIVLWLAAFRDLSRSEVFTGGSRTLWFCIILLGPVAGSIAYFSAKRNIARFSSADPGRLSRLLAHEKKA
jgi:drug/metabolite transporter (DMT)-like permease